MNKLNSNGIIVFLLIVGLVSFALGFTISQTAHDKMDLTNCKVIEARSEHETTEYLACEIIS